MIQILLLTMNGFLLHSWHKASCARRTKKLKETLHYSTEYAWKTQNTLKIVMVSVEILMTDNSTSYVHRWLHKLFQNISSAVGKRAAGGTAGRSGSVERG